MSHQQTNLSASELILNGEGRIYHINLKPEDLAGTVLTVGDPARVDAVSKYFDDIEFKTQYREFITHTGYIGKKRLSVISTGIGTPNIDIVLNELDALVNIDFATRQLKPQTKSLDIIRLGTAGGMQADIPLGASVMTSYALGLDGLLNFYDLQYSELELALNQALQQYLQPQQFPIKPYVVAAADELLQQLSKACIPGMTTTTPGFYGPQNRVLRGKIIVDDLLQRLAAFEYQQHKFANFEMETSAIYGMGRLLNHNCCSVSAIIANRATGKFSSHMAADVDNMIKSVLESLTSSSVVTA